MSGARERLWERAQSAWDARRDPLADPEVEALLLEHPELFAELDAARTALDDLARAGRGRRPTTPGASAAAMRTTPGSTKRSGPTPVSTTWPVGAGWRRAAAVCVPAALAAGLLLWVALALEPAAGSGAAGRPAPAPTTRAPSPEPGAPGLPAVVEPGTPAARVVSARFRFSVRRPGGGPTVAHTGRAGLTTRAVHDRPALRGPSPVRDLSLTVTRTEPWLQP